MPDPEISTDSIVLLGSFNPAIVHPDWLRHRGLLREGEYEDSEVEVIVPEFSRFRIAWLRVQVTPTHFQLVTLEPDRRLLLRDLAVNVFEILNETPIKGLGLNRDQHFAVPDDKTLNAIGHALVPVKPWTSVMSEPGMLSLTVRDVRPDGRTGHINVRVEPSLSLTPGLFVGVNDHYQLDDDRPEAVPLDATDATVILSTEWDASTSRADGYVESILRLG